MPLAQEYQTGCDATTGLSVTRLTGHASNHCYFTNPGWFDDHRRLLFASGPSERIGLRTLDLESGEQTELLPGEEGLCASRIAVDAARHRAVFWVSHPYGDHLDLIDLLNGERVELLRLPRGWQGVMPNFTADGRYVCCGMTQLAPGLGFNERFQSKPVSRVLSVEVATGLSAILHERDCWLGHINTAPGQPDLLSFCHEGPWTKVEHRVWALEISTQRTWKVHADMVSPACIGHEYWLADGRRIAYHGFDSQPQPVLGIIDVHDGSLIEHRQPVKTKHSHSLDGHLIVGDGSEDMPWILAWICSADTLEGPFKVCHHGGGWSEQRLHVHPRIAPDGRTVLFTSDVAGHPQIYTVRLPDSLDDIRSLPSL